MGQSVGSDGATAKLVRQQTFNQTLVQRRALSNSRDPRQKQTVGQILLVAGASNLITDEVGPVGDGSAKSSSQIYLAVGRLLSDGF